MFCVIADGPERAYLRKHVAHNGFYACDTCKLKRGEDSHGKGCWPAVMRECNNAYRLAALRTEEELKEILNGVADDGFVELPEWKA